MMISMGANSQVNTSQGEIPPENDTIIIERPERIRFDPEPFIRLGFDISAIARQIAEPEVRQFEFSADTELFFNWFPIVEGGVMFVNADREDFSYNASGYFAKAGIDFNLLGRPDKTQNDLVVFGLRYGFSSLTHEAPFFSVTNPYWGDSSGSIAQDNFNLHFIEFAGGVRTEVFPNFFMGWTLKTRVRLTETKNADLQPYYIAGYGQGNRRAPVMIHYSLYYRFNY